MSKENEKEFVEIEDPIAVFDMDTDDVIDDSEEIIGGADELQVNEFEPSKKASALSGFSEKLSKFFKPVKKVADVGISNRNALTILCCVLFAAVIAAILIFTSYSGATYTSGKTVSEWADEWNSVSFTNNATYSVYSSFQGNADMKTMFISDTDHVYLTPDDVAALKKGETITLFDDLAKLSVETHKGEFKKAHMAVDYSKLCDFYYGENYNYDSYIYSPGLFDDSTIRTLGCIAMFVNTCNDKVSTENEILNKAIEIYLKDGSAYTYDGGNRLDVGDYIFMLYYTYEDVLIVTSDSDLSASDISGSDISASDIVANNMHASVETHLIVNMTCTHKNAGEKKHAADWSWWNELFPKKEDKGDVIPDALPLPGSPSDISGSDISGSDLSASDIL